MNDLDFKVKTLEKLSMIENEVKHINLRLPVCEKDKIKESIAIQKKLIFLILASYLPLLVGIALAMR